MNYRHAFHAGNFADVFKHAVLVDLIDALQAKPAAICYVDTHAGRGRYDLRGDAARRTGEADAGIGLLQDPGAALAAPLQRYLDLVDAFTVRHGAGAYPGSPLIAQTLMRAQDLAILCELQPEEATALRAALAGDRRFAVHQRDGYEALKALLPPAEKRGLVLIDPPFEAQAGEFPRIQQALDDALRRWSNAIYAIWYPIKQGTALAPFHRWLREVPAGDVLAAELLLRPANTPLRLNGCGMAIINPPWRLGERLATWLQPLAQRLGGRDARGRIVLQRET